MFSALNPSREGRTRRGVAFTCGLLAQALPIGAAVFLGVLFPNELPESQKHYALIWFRAWMPPEKPAVKSPFRTVEILSKPSPVYPATLRIQFRLAGQSAQSEEKI
jgi:hypothetical protein